MPPVTLWVVLGHWDLEPSVIAGLVAMCLLFVWLQRQPLLRARPGGIPCFIAGAVFLALALLSPLDELSDRYLLTAHMIQHLLVVLVVAPLLARAMPAPWAARLAIHPILAFVLFNAVFTFSHVPAWYEATLVNEPLHVVEHIAYLATALLNWLPVVSPARGKRLSYPLQMLYLFLETLPMFLVGSLLSLSDTAIYPLYLRAPRIVSMSAIEDQSMAGLLMWIGGSFFYLGAMTIIFFKWANREIGLDQPVIMEDQWLESHKLSA